MNKKILILVQEHTTDDIVFVNYKKVWLKTIEYVKQNNLPIDVLFLNTDINLANTYEIIGDTLYSKYEENYWDALLIKVMNGFDYFMSSDYDLVFKTNLSTIINFDLFYNFCNERYQNDEIVYDGLFSHYNDFAFCSGAGMLLNKNSVKIIMDNKDKVTKEWTDDIFFGYVLNKLNSISPNNRGLSRFDVLTNSTLTSQIKHHTHIRIKIRNNDQDVFYTNGVYDILYNNFELPITLQQKHQRL